MYMYVLPVYFLIPKITGNKTAGTAQWSVKMTQCKNNWQGYHSIASCVKQGMPKSDTLLKVIVMDDTFHRSQ